MEWMYCRSHSVQPEVLYEPIQVGSLDWTGLNRMEWMDCGSHSVLKQAKSSPTMKQVEWRAMSCQVAVALRGPNSAAALAHSLLSLPVAVATGDHCVLQHARQI